MIGEMWANAKREFSWKPAFSDHAADQDFVCKGPKATFAIEKRPFRMLA
jgi:hypothetical protein